jgi:predicted nucleotidyltransferase
MNVVEAALRAIAADLDRRAAGWALVGGFAVSIRSEPRFTRDVDVAIAVADDPEAEALVRSLMADGYAVLASVEQDAVHRLATARLSLPGGGESGAIVDLLFASSGVEPEIVAAAETIEVLPALFMRVARTGHLIALKLLARDDETRPQDAGDLQALAAVADAEDFRLAADAVGLIEARGFHRDRDLGAALASLRG